MARLRRAQLDVNGDATRLQLERRRRSATPSIQVLSTAAAGMRRSFGQARFSPGRSATRWSESTPGADRLTASSRTAAVVWKRVASRRQNSASTSRTPTAFAYHLHRRLRVPAAAIPNHARHHSSVGGYDFGTARLTYNRANRQRIAGNLSLESGTFYNGHKTTIGLASGRVNVTPRFSVEPTYSLNRVELTQGEFTSHLVGSRVTFTATPFMFTSALLQYNSETHSISANVRLRWEYRPGSELFVVYNDERDTFARAFPDLMNRAFIVKINRLFSFRQPAATCQVRQTLA